MTKNSIGVLNGGVITFTSVQVIFWGFRIQQDAAGVKHDLKWILSFLLLLYRQELYLGILGAPSCIWKSVWLFLLSIILLLICYRWRVDWRFSQSSAGRGNKTQDPCSTLKLKPLIFPCRTSHTRMFPQKHSFSYSYLFVGVPIGYQGSSGSLLSAESGILPDEDKKTKHIPKTKSWFRVEAADYLSRGNTLGLEGNLHAYLKSQVGFGIT